jgi:hypothetical protein
MVVLGSLEYAIVAHGSAEKEQLQGPDPIHNEGLMVVVGVFCICRTNNLLCEAGMANLSSRRALKAATTAIRIARLKHPMKQVLEDAETNDCYATKPNRTKPFFIRAVDTGALIGIELRKVDMMVRRQQSPWMTNAGHQIITTFCAIPKGAETERIRAEMRQVIQDDGLSDCESIYTDDGSLKEEKVDCKVVLPTATLKY